MMVLGLRRGLGRVRRRKKTEEDEGESRTLIRALVGLSLFFLFMFDFFSGGDGRRRGGIISIFAEAGGGTSGGGVGGSNSGGFWLSSTGLQPSNVGIAIAVTAMAGLALAATVVYSRR